MLVPVVIGQDEQTELHVQAVIQGGRRHLDIRIWRRGPTGFAPSRNALTLDPADLDALEEGITELLEASNGGRQVARVVWDKDERRRLRAETEPFGTRFVARLSFWQRVRDSWKPASDGLVLAADGLKPLQALIRDVRPRLEPPVAVDSSLQEGEALEEQERSQMWPLAGADWSTVEGDRMAFHPRGIRITGVLARCGEAHCLVLHQWKRQDTLFLPGETSLQLNLPDLDLVLASLHGLIDMPAERRTAGEQLPLSDGSTVWLRISTDEPSMLHIDQLPPATDDRTETGYEPRLLIAAEHLPRFGRALWQSRGMLVARLSAVERQVLLNVEELEAIAENHVVVEELVPDETDEADGPERQSTAIDEVAPVFNEEPAVQHVQLPEEHDAAEPAPSVDAEVVWEPRQAEPAEPQRRSVSIGDLTLGRYHVFLFLQEGPERALFLQWEGRSIQLPVDRLEELLTCVRDLYYDTLRGRRGPSVTIGARPAVMLSVHHQGSITYLALDQDLDGKNTHLAFAAGEVPAFLNMAEAAIVALGS